MKGLVHTFAIAAAAAVCTFTAAAQSAPQPALPRFHSGASLVALNVTVQDHSSKYVGGLKPEDFAVYEDGVRQDVQFFESDSVPVDLIVLLDSSASMTDKIDLVHTAATGFLRTLRPGDRGAVVAFSDNVTVLQPLSEDRELLERAVASTRPHGATALNNAVYIALKQFGQAARTDGVVRRQAIAVLSDGEDTSSLISFDDVLDLARKTGVNIYTVGVRSKYAVQRTKAETGRQFLSESDYSLTALARETGALSFFPMVADLKGVYASIAQELASQYSIGYIPANPRIDGRFHRVNVQVVSHPELRPRTRMGYTSDAAMAVTDYPAGPGR